MEKFWLRKELVLKNRESSLLMIYSKKIIEEWLAFKFIFTLIYKILKLWNVLVDFGKGNLNYNKNIILKFVINF